MSAHFEQLDQVLGQQIAGMTAVKNWLPRKIELIKAHRLQELEAFVQREEEQANRLTQAESQRQVLMGLLAREFNLPPRETALTLGELIALAPAPYAERFEARRQALAVLAAQIGEGHRRLDALLRVSMDYVHYTLDIFARLATAAPAAGYGGTGDVMPASNASWLVNRTA